ncbi:branched-chain amino acid ABC transporter permease [Euzebya rosea]|uniref:branched-chain amino acid ABC transporter permease n=1 Tax=Euzebya rosea TaxID=2052804 RepID=UPI0013003253|nr:branched-chain amino acid ABC transporter permease [Euzebya rosea]
MFLLQLLLNGIAIGAIYALVALGFVLVFKATSVLNFAHGSFLMIATYLAVTFIDVLELPFAVSLVVIAVVLAATGVILHYGIMRHMVGKPFFSVVLVTVGLEIVIRAGLLIFYGPTPRGRLTALPQGQLNFGTVTIPYVNGFMVLAAAISVGAFLVFFQRSRLGLHMRAVAENLEAAAAMGIDPNKIYAAAWGIGLTMAAIGGVMYAHYTPSVSLGVAVIGLRAFPAAILGGIDSVGGAILGGLLVGIVESVGAGYLGAEYRDVIAFGIMFAVLLWRPSGLYGTRDLVRV